RGDVLRNRLPGDRQLGAERRDTGRALAQQRLHHAAARGVRERAEDLVERSRFAPSLTGAQAATSAKLAAIAASGKRGALSVTVTRVRPCEGSATISNSTRVNGSSSEAHHQLRRLGASIDSTWISRSGSSSQRSRPSSLTSASKTSSGEASTSISRRTVGLSSVSASNSSCSLSVIASPFDNRMVAIVGRTTV